MQVSETTNHNAGLQNTESQCRSQKQPILMHVSKTINHNAGLKSDQSQCRMQVSETTNRAVALTSV